MIKISHYMTYPVKRDLPARGRTRSVRLSDIWCQNSIIIVVERHLALCAFFILQDSHLTFEVAKRLCKGDGGTSHECRGDFNARRRT